MKAIIRTRYGPPDVLQVIEVVKPVPKSNEVLIKIHAATVTLGDCEIRALKVTSTMWLILRLYLGIFRPRIKMLGQELAGEIEAVGSKVTKLKKGDRIFAPADMKFGAYAEYKCLSGKHTFGTIPDNVSFGEAATIPTGGVNGLHFVRKCKIQTGEKVLINGAGGSIGTYALQLAKLKGAVVTCVDSGEKLDMLREIGADYVMDYQKEDYWNNGETYDAIIDVVGKIPYSKTIKRLKPGGRLMLGNPILPHVFQGIWTTMTSDKRVISQLASYHAEDMNYLAGLISGKKIKVVIDKTYSLENIQQAHQYVEDGHKAGNVVVRIVA